LVDDVFGKGVCAIVPEPISVGKKEVSTSKADRSNSKI
jgi:hypothetical protein